MKNAIHFFMGPYLFYIIGWFQLLMNRFTVENLQKCNNGVDKEKEKLYNTSKRCIYHKAFL